MAAGWISLFPGDRVIHQSKLERKTPNTKTDVGRSHISYAVDCFTFSTRKTNRRLPLAILPMIFDKMIGWRYRFSMSRNRTTWSIHGTPHGGTSSKPFRGARLGTSGGRAPPGACPWARRGRDFALLRVVWWIIEQQSHNCAPAVKRQILRRHGL